MRKVSGWWHIYIRCRFTVPFGPFFKPKSDKIVGDNEFYADRVLTVESVVSLYRQLLRAFPVVGSTTKSDELVITTIITASASFTHSLLCYATKCDWNMGGLFYELATHHGSSIFRTDSAPYALSESMCLKQMCMWRLKRDLRTKVGDHFSLLVVSQRSTRLTFISSSPQLISQVPTLNFHVPESNIWLCRLSRSNTKWDRQTATSLKNKPDTTASWFLRSASLFIFEKVPSWSFQFHVAMKCYGNTTILHHIFTQWPSAPVFLVEQGDGR